MSTNESELQILVELAALRDMAAGIQSSIESLITMTNTFNSRMAIIEAYANKAEPPTEINPIGVACTIQHGYCKPAVCPYSNCTKKIRYEEAHHHE